MRALAALGAYRDLYLAAALFGLYSAVQASTRQPASPLVQLVFAWGLATFVTLWVCRDARRRRCTPCFDFGTFVFLTWMVAVPVYLIATRGWRGLGIIFLMLLTVYFAAMIVLLMP